MFETEVLYFGKKYTVLKKVIVTLLGNFGAPCSGSAPPSWFGARGIVPPSFRLCRPGMESYAPSCPGMEDITFQIERLLLDQLQKSLRQSKIADLFAAKWSKIVNLRLFVTAWIRRLIVWCTIVNRLQQEIRFASAKSGCCCWFVNLFNLGDFHRHIST